MIFKKKKKARPGQGIPALMNYGRREAALLAGAEVLPNTYTITACCLHRAGSSCCSKEVGGTYGDLSIDIDQGLKAFAFSIISKLGPDVRGHVVFMITHCAELSKMWSGKIRRVLCQITGFTSCRSNGMDRELNYFAHLLRRRSMLV